MSSSNEFEFKPTKYRLISRLVGAVGIVLTLFLGAFNLVISILRGKDVVGGILFVILTLILSAILGYLAYKVEEALADAERKRRGRY